MPVFERDGVSINYQEFGSGYPILLFAPGGMRSSIRFWENSPFDPTRELKSDFRVIAMDQRNAGRSRAPLSASDGWHSYTGDHLALLDHLGIRSCHLMGGCIGSSYCMRVIEKARGRVSAAVLQNPIGLSPRNRELFYAMFDGWAADLKASHPEIDDAGLHAFRDRMYGGDFVFNVSRDFVRSIATPLMILMGSDDYHPTPISEEIAALAPNAQLLRDWKTPELIAQTVKRVREFLASHTPKS
ncbi:MAG TPA: alpha/beta hydrolase [Candidatus Binataceae bacterium]|nr:alpha/beta hydrolase [Candidatus Binataceae bacterium]